jgi:hypothetical protein
LRARYFIMGAAGGVAATTLVLLALRPHKPPTEDFQPALTGALGLRAPAAISRPPESPGVCQNFYRAICGKHGETRDPTGSLRPDIEGEVQSLRVYEEIIHEHPDWSSEQVDEELVRQVYTPKKRGRVEGAVHYVRHTIEKLIEREPAFSAAEKRALKARVHKIELQLPPPASVYADEPDLFTKNDVFYERTTDGKMRLRVGGAYLNTSKSWFNLLFTIAHEFGHSIDPCELRAAGIAIPAYDRLSSCLVRGGLVAVLKNRVECGENDQLSETFADWLAVRVTAEALRTYSTEFPRPQIVNAAVNSVRDLCEQDEGFLDTDLQYHPPPSVRIQGIFGSNPEIRELLGCGPLAGAAYCGFDSPSEGKAK